MAPTALAPLQTTSELAHSGIKHILTKTAPSVIANGSSNPGINELDASKLVFTRNLSPHAVPEPDSPEVWTQSVIFSELSLPHSCSILSCKTCRRSKVLPRPVSRLISNPHRDMLTPKSLRQLCTDHMVTCQYVFSAFIFPIFDQILSLETCLESIYWVDTFQGSMLPLN